MADLTPSPFDISFEDWQTILQYANAASEDGGNEISGMMVMLPVEDEEGGVLYKLYNPVILKQEVSGGTTEMDKQELASYYSQMFVDYGEQVRFVWWHSHVKMDAFMSGTDTETIKEFAGSAWTISLVVNIYGKYELRLNYFSPVSSFIKVKLNITGAPEEETIVKRGKKIVRRYKSTAAVDATPSKAIVAEVKSKVEERTPTYGYNNYSNNGEKFKIYNTVRDLIDKARDDKNNYSVEQLRADLDHLDIMFGGDYIIQAPLANDLADEKNRSWTLARDCVVTINDVFVQENLGI